MPPVLPGIDHVVVVMMENRSFDNLLGWCYDGSQPAANLPAEQPPRFEGLRAGAYSNRLAAPGSPAVYASFPPKAYPPACPFPNQVPTPDPHEEFAYVTEQLFGGAAPRPGVPPDMSGFLQNYSTTAAGPAAAAQIMEGFGPEQAGVINALARRFAVCDRWFASAPTQTWPNRGFVHTGSSDGHIDNENYEPYANATIFNVLSAQGRSWGVFHETIFVPALTHIQFTRLWDQLPNFHRFREFKRRARAAADAPAERKLPAYSFIEPRFSPEPGDLWHLFRTQYPADYHPPHNICRGERFLAEVYGAVRASPYRDRILLVVTFDEHGGCYDHVPPPWGSAPPQPGPVAAKNGFGFDRFGVRVPALVIASQVTPGLVFREEPGGVPYDHASILATLRDWLGLDRGPGGFLPSPRIARAPTLAPVLAAAGGRLERDWPEVKAACRVDATDTGDDIPLNDVQKSILAHAMRQDSGETEIGRHARRAKADFHTYAHALDYLRRHRRRRT
jgi:phospholipase C